MTIYCFHEIGDQANEWCLSPKSFAEFAEKYKNHTFHFDDGRKGIYTYWPLITQNLRKMPTIFLVPNFLQGLIPKHENYTKFMTINNVKLLLQLGWKLGSHTMTHRNLTTLDTTELVDELRESQRYLETVFKREVTELSLPYGAISERVLKEAGKLYDKIYGLKPTMSPAIERVLVKK